MPNRRAFMKFVASSPLFATVPSIAEAFAQQAPPSLIDKAAAHEPAGALWQKEHPDT